MKKPYYIVDRETNEVFGTIYFRTRRQDYYKERPETRKGIRIQYIGLLCMGIALLLFTIGCFLRSLIGYALFFTVLVVALGAVGQIAIKNGEMTAGKTNPSKVKAGPWLDPYGLAQAPAPEDGKKTYYLVDSERNAIVDVLRLGKRAEAQLLRRAARQSCKIRG